MNMNDTENFFAMFDDVPLLSKEEEVALANQIKAGDMDAKWHFISANIGLVVDTVTKYKEKLVYTSFSEALYDGLAGLVRAVNDFDPSKGCRFSTYAIWWIKNGIFHAMENGDKDESYESLIIDDEDGTHLNTGVEKDSRYEFDYDNIEFRVDFSRALSYLKPIEAKIFSLHSGFCGSRKYSFSEIAKLVGLKSKQRANQIFAEAKEKLEQPELARYYADYFDADYDGGAFSLAA